MQRTNEEIRQWLCRGQSIRKRIEALERSVDVGSPELTAAADQERDRLGHVLAEITRAISRIEDNTLATVLHDRFINDMTWKEIARRIGYSESNTKQVLFPKALHEISAVLEAGTAENGTSVK